MATTTICVNNCNDVRRDRRYVDQQLRSPAFPAQQRFPGDYTLREDFKVGRVISDIPPMLFDKSCCDWNPGSGNVTIFDQDGDPTDESVSYPILSTPAPTGTSAALNGNRTSLLNVEVEVYSSSESLLGTVTISSAVLSGSNTLLTWNTVLSPAPDAGGSIRLSCDGEAPQENGACFNPRGATRTPYEVLNFTCLPLRKNSRVFLHREYKSGSWIAIPVNAPGRIRVRMAEDAATAAGEACSGPWDVELMDYDHDPEGGTCELIGCEDDEEETIIVQVYSDLCQTAKEDTVWDAVPYEDCDGCLKYWLVPKPVCRKRIRIIDQIDPPNKQECHPVNANAQEAPLGNKQQRFSWMNFSADPGHTALLHEADGSVDKQDRYQYLHLYFNSLSGAPLSPTTTSCVVTGDATHLIGKKVFIYDGAPDLLGEVVILTAVYDPTQPPGIGQTTLTWTPPLDSAPLAGSTIRVPEESCFGPHTVQVLDYVTTEGVSQQDPTVCSLEPCEGETLEVYSELPCTLETGTDWEAVPYNKCDTQCCRYFIQDTRPEFIHGIADENIPALDGKSWCSGLLNVMELGPVEGVCATEVNVQNADCSNKQERVFNGCPFEVNQLDRVKAHLEGCNYVIISVCCPPESA